MIALTVVTGLEKEGRRGYESWGTTQGPVLPGLLRDGRMRVRGALR